ncbi:MAG: TetR/AcrR family transcriptional regulator [Solirubrobacterales bacterium]|nr:TetR/AcrR family transcriptional regulator [Solirubrobacterales bacterium]
MIISPTTKKGRETRTKILGAAREVFAEDGYVDARMVDIAERAGVSNGGLYRYFTSKEAVFSELIADLHENLYEASGRTRHSFADDPLAALTDANRGYIEAYFESRDVMRAFIEAAGVDPELRRIWWDMRDRHVDRFVKALESGHGITEVDGVPAATVAESMACMVEQCCYVWFAHEEMGGRKISIDDAVVATSDAWYAAFFRRA